MTATRSRKSSSRKRSEGLDDVLLLLGRAYFNYVGLLERVLHQTGLNTTLAPGMGCVMQALFEADDQIIKSIAERVSLSQSTLTGILHRMEQQGLIERRRDAYDGRATRIRLSEKGRSLESQWQETVDLIHGAIGESMQESEFASLKQGLTRIAEALRSGAHRE